MYFQKYSSHVPVMKKITIFEATPRYFPYKIRLSEPVLYTVYREPNLEYNALVKPLGKSLAVFFNTIHKLKVH